ncbi:MAG: hypothetical protein WAS51_14485 [Ilumatobacteraceae bacterium]
MPQTASGFRAIPAAAGYPQYSGNLINPVISMDLLERFYCSTVFGEIASTDYLGDLTKGGDQITFWREPCVIVRDHIKDGIIKHDVLEAESVTLVIDKAKEFSVKIAKIDEHMMQGWEMFKAALLKNASRAMAENIDCEILGSVYADVACTNRGARAGCISRSYNLGQTGNPVPLDSTNIVEFFTYMHGVLNEACVPREGRFLVIPTQLEILILNSELKAAYLTGMSETPLLNGRIPSQIAGFDIYVSNNTCRVFDPAINAPAYHIFGGVKGSIVFASVLENTRVIEDKDSWDIYYQGLQAYGYDVVRPEALVGAYVRF